MRPLKELMISDIRLPRPALTLRVCSAGVWVRKLEPGPWAASSCHRWKMSSPRPQTVRKGMGLASTLVPKLVLPPGMPAKARISSTRRSSPGSTSP